MSNYPRLDGTGLTTLLTRLAAVIKQGHTVVNSSGTELTQRNKLKIVGATITDDSTNDTTIVTVTGGGGGGLSQEIIAEEFDPTGAYVAGDYCTKDNALYKFTEAHTGAWDSSDVEEVDVMTEMPKGITSAELEILEQAFNPQVNNMEPLTPTDLQDIKNAFVINEM